MSAFHLYRNDPFKRAQVYTILMQIFLLLYIPLLGKSGNLAMLAIAAYWLTEPALWTKVKAAFRDKVVIALISYYLIFIVGMFYTENFREGFSQLERKLPLLLFPILFYTLDLPYNSIIRLLKTYLVATLLAGLAGLLNGIYLYSSTGLTSYLYSDNLTLLMDGGQGIYFAVTVTVAIVFVVYLWIKKQFSGWETYVYGYVFLPFFVLLLFLLAGRLSLGIVTMLGLFLLAFVIIRQKRFRLGLSILAVVIGTLITLGILFPKTVNRFKSLGSFHFEYSDAREVYHFDETEYEGRWNGLTIRLAIWSCTLNAARENLVMGVGTGDHLDKLFESYREKNFQQGLIHEFGPHNQYLHAILSVGIIGLIVLLASLIIPAIQAYRNENWLYLVFLFVAAGNMLTMDFLDVYRGVIFFAFLNSLLLFQLCYYRRSTSV